MVLSIKQVMLTDRTRSVRMLIILGSRSFSKAHKGLRGALHLCQHDLRTTVRNQAPGDEHCHLGSAALS